VGAEGKNVAVALAEEIGDDPATYRSWAARNARDVDLSIDGSRGRGPSIPVGHLSVTLQTRSARRRSREPVRHRVLARRHGRPLTVVTRTTAGWRR
jgi:hypothetical protein